MREIKVGSHSLGDIADYLIESDLRIVAIFLFGSWARNSHAPDSDVDILIVHQGKPESNLRIAAGATEDTHELVIPCILDVNACTRIEFENPKSEWLINATKDSVLLCGSL